ncbi:MAG: hypothetical protein FWF56_05785 [Firmicutes bacterium]|nr:hypothetical protein [Bacillota bacterium]MCL1953412.1 hypothetical protein [Bacillota bacterium]
MIDKDSLNKIIVYKNIFLLYTICSLSIPLMIFISNISATAVYNRDVPISIITIIVAVVWGAISFFRYFYANNIKDFVDSRFLKAEFVLGLSLFVLCMIWFFVVRDSVVGRGAVVWLQDFVSPFLFFLYILCVLIGLKGTQKAGYFYHKYVYDGMAYEKHLKKGSFLLRILKPFHAKFSTDLEKVQYYNRFSFVIELYWAMLALPLFFGTTMFGLVFGIALYLHFVVGNYNRIKLSSFSKNKNNTLFWLYNGTVFLCLLLACLSFREGFFIMLFRFSNSDKSSYSGYGNVIPFYLALLCSIITIIIRNIFKKHFQQMESVYTEN